jgi:hypothetical protein
MAQAGSAYNLHERHKQNHVKIGNWVEERALIESAPGMCVPVRNGRSALLTSSCTRPPVLGRGRANSRSCRFYSLISLLPLPPCSFLACFFLLFFYCLHSCFTTSRATAPRQRGLPCCCRCVARLRRSTRCVARL